MRGCTRCGSTYATGVLYCPNDGAPTVELPTSAAAPGSARPGVPAPRPPRPSGSTIAPPPRPSTVGLAPPGAPPPDPFAGKMVGNFKLTRRIGAGGMGAVYEGEHPLVGIRVAVKLLGGSYALERDLVDRFFAEARTLNSVAHDNIVKVIDLGVHPEGFYYCVMELLEGETLAALMMRGKVELGHALNILVQAGEALVAAHEKGIVHRDLKPANVMLVKHPATGAELVKLVDFGIAKLQTQVSGSSTVTGTVIGTPAYMSPEQAAGRTADIDHRSDLYSLGMVAYELVAGRHPFEGRAMGELIVAQVTQHPPPLRPRFPIPKRLDDAIMRLLSKPKEERFPSAQAVVAELRAIVHELHGPPALPAAPPPLHNLPAAPPPQHNLPAPEPAPHALPAPPPAAAPIATPAGSAPTQRVIVEVAPRMSPVEIPRPPPPAPAPAPASLPQSTTSASGVRLATRVRPSAGLGVRPAFLLAFVLAGSVLGATVAGVFDAESLIGEVATSLGLGSRGVKVKRAAPRSLDGTGAVFDAVGRVESCRASFRAARVPLGLTEESDATLVSSTLLNRLGAQEELRRCLEERTLPANERWAAEYLFGVAAFDLAMELDKLPPSLRDLSRGTKDADGGAPFTTEHFARLSTAYFDRARTGAPETHLAFIDRYVVDADVLVARSRDRATPAP